MMELASEAIVFAVKAHDGMRRKRAKVPYILHPMEAAAIVGSLTDNQEVIAAAVLHDVVEDTPITIEEVREHFGERVAELVASETEDKREGLPPEQTWRIRKEESIALLRATKDIEVKMLYLGDKLANMRSLYQQWMQYGNAMWEGLGFHQSDPKQHGWYYREIAKCLTEFSDTLAWKEYDELIRIVFEEGRKQ